MRYGAVARFNLSLRLKIRRSRNIAFGFIDIFDQLGNVALPAFFENVQVVIVISMWALTKCGLSFFRVSASRSNSARVTVL